MRLGERGDAVNIAGLLIQARKQRARRVRECIERIPGAEVHAVTADGRLVVTVEAGGEDMARALDRLSGIEGVCATTLVYHHSEPIEDDT